MQSPMSQQASVNAQESELPEWLRELATSADDAGPPEAVSEIAMQRIALRLLRQTAEAEERIAIADTRERAAASVVDLLDGKRADLNRQLDSLQRFFRPS